VDLGDVVMIPDDVSAPVVPSSDLRVVIKSAAKLKHLVPDAICVADPLAFTGCERGREQRAKVSAGVGSAGQRNRPAEVAGVPNGHPGPRKFGSGLPSRTSRSRGLSRLTRPVHPVTVWRGRLSVALDALQAAASASEADQAAFERRSPVETTHVQLPTGDRLQIPTGAETLRLKGYLLISRNTTRDYAEFAELVDAMDAETAAVVLSGIDRYYCGRPPGRNWIATQLVRRLADPRPSDTDEDRWSEPEAEAEWEEVRLRCLSVAVAMLEEAR
jgi:heme transporter